MCQLCKAIIFSQICISHSLVKIAFENKNFIKTKKTFQVEKVKYLKYPCGHYSSKISVDQGFETFVAFTLNNFPLDPDYGALKQVYHRHTVLNINDRVDVFKTIADAIS